jgi:hypothetical protein
MRYGPLTVIRSQSYRICIQSAALLLSSKRLEKVTKGNACPYRTVMWRGQKKNNRFRRTFLPMFQMCSISEKEILFVNVFYGGTRNASVTTRIISDFDVTWSSFFFFFDLLSITLRVRMRAVNFRPPVRHSRLTDRMMCARFSYDLVHDPRIRSKEDTQKYYTH